MRFQTKTLEAKWTIKSSSYSNAEPQAQREVLGQSDSVINVDVTMSEETKIGARELISSL